MKILIHWNIWLIWLITILNGLIFYAPIFILYLHQELLDFTEVTLIIAFQAIFIIIFEIPSGAFSDLFGRKRSMVIGAILHIFSILLLYFAFNFLFLMFFAFSSSLVQSLTSGTVETIVYDSSKSNDTIKDNLKKISFKQAIAINGSLWPISASVASLVGGFLTVYGYKLTILITLIPVFMKLALTLLLKELEYQNEKSVNLFKQISNSMKFIIKDNQLIILLLSGFLVYSFAEVAFQIRPVYLTEIDFPIQFIGVILTFSFAFSFLGSILAERLSRMISYKNLLIYCQIAIGMLFFAPTYIPLAFINASIMSIESFFWGMRWPIQSDWINSKIQSNERATINSTSNLMNQLGFTIFIIFFGFSLESIGAIWSIRIIGLIQILTVIFLFLLNRKNDSK